MASPASELRARHAPLKPMSNAASVEQTFARGLAEHRAGRTAEAARIYRVILQQDPRHEPARFLSAALALEGGNAAEARALLSSLASEHPENAIYWCNLGEALRRERELEQAAQALSRAVMLKPDLAEAHFNLGLVTNELGDRELALHAFARAVELKPDQPQLQTGLATALAERGEPLRAIGHFQCALLRAPESGTLWSKYAACLRSARRFDAALAAATRAVELEPRSSNALQEQSAALALLGRVDAALRSAEHAVRLEPRSAAAASRLAAALVDSGDLEQGLSAYRRALELEPNDPLAHSNLVFLLAFQRGTDASAILVEARAWALRHAERFAAHHRPFQNEPRRERRLRVGYVSSNFNDHCQALFTLPVLEQHDRESFELFAFADLAHEDQVTAELRAQFDHWHDISGLPPETAAERIRSLKIDVLVDLTMHMATPALLIFACRPCPVQIAWLAYPGTTGLDAMDYRITDRHLDPPDAPPQPYAETSLVLPDSFWCYRATEAPTVAPLPALEGGYVTFGCLNSIWKLNDTTLELWAEVLHGLASSRLRLMAPEGAARSRVLSTLKRAKIAPERVEFASRRPRKDYLELYAGIDICLDTLPYNGHTTSLDAFYMGVPVVSLVGSTVVGRAGLCHARNLGLPALASQTPEDFVRVARELASDVPGLASLRRSLRERMQQSPLMDAPRFTRNLEAQYRQAFARWCDGKSPSPRG